MSERLLPIDLDFDGPFPRLSRRLRLGIVGGGRISATQAMAARLTDRWEIVAGALSSDPEKASVRGKRAYLDPGRSYVSFEEMATAEAKRDDGVDAVMITTPNHLHHEAARTFLAEGIDVLCEKPLTNSIAEAEDLAEIAKSSGCVFGVCYVMSCYPMIRQAREIVRSGGLGRIQQIHAEFMQDWMVPDGFDDQPHVKWRLDPELAGPSGSTGDIGTHAAHLASFVSGLPLSHVRAEFHVCGAPKALEDTVFMTTRHADSVPGTLMATRLAPGNRGGLRIRVFGTEAGLEWDMENCEVLKLNRFGEPDRIIRRGHGHGVSAATERLVRTARGFPEGLIEAWANLYTEFALAVAARRDGRNLPSDWLGMPEVGDGVNGVRFIFAAIRSHEAGGDWQEV